MADLDLKDFADEEDSNKKEKVGMERDRIDREASRKRGCLRSKAVLTRSIRVNPRSPSYQI